MGDRRDRCNRHRRLRYLEPLLRLRLQRRLWRLLCLCKRRNARVGLRSNVNGRRRRMGHRNHLLHLQLLRYRRRMTKIRGGNDGVWCLLVGELHSSSHPLVKLTHGCQHSTFLLSTPTPIPTLIQMQTQMQTEKAMRT